MEVGHIEHKGTSAILVQKSKLRDGRRCVHRDGGSRIDRIRSIIQRGVGVALSVFEVDPGNGTSGLIGNGAVSVVVDGDDDE